MSEITFTVGDLPTNLQHVAKQNQKLQGNSPSDKTPLLKNKAEGNFDWDASPQGLEFWHNALLGNDYDLIDTNKDENLKLYYVSLQTSDNNNITFYFDGDSEVFEFSSMAFNFYGEVMSFKNSLEGKGYLLINTFEFALIDDKQTK